MFEKAKEKGSANRMRPLVWKLSNVERATSNAIPPVTLFAAQTAANLNGTGTGNGTSPLP